MATDDTTATEARPGGSAAGRPAADVARDLGVEPEQGLSADEKDIERAKGSLSQA